MLNYRGSVRSNLGASLLLVAGCGSSTTATNAYEYTEQDMEQFAVGTWAGNWDAWDAGQGAKAFTLEVHRPLPAKTPLCGTRQFSSIELLCISSSEMRLEGTLNVPADASLTNVALAGDMTVHGLRLSNVLLTLKDPASDLQVIAEWATRSLGSLPRRACERRHCHLHPWLQPSK